MQDRKRLSSRIVIKAVSIISNLGLLGAVVLFIIVMSFVSTPFLSLANFRNLLAQSTVLMALAIGETFVILTGGIDLSIGGILAVSSAIGLGLMVNNGVPVVVGIMVIFLIGLTVGFLNGIAVTKIGITPLITTLAFLGITRGAVFVYTNGANITPVPKLFITLGTGSFLNIPISVYFVSILILLAHIILSKTTFGRSIYASGGNELAARLAGIATGKTIMLAYMTAGLMASIAGIILMSRLESAGPRAGIGIELTVIAAVVIGGTSLVGGQGGIIGTIFGVILIALVGNAINLLGVPPSWDELSKGIIIFLAALVDVFRRKYVTERASLPKG